MNPILCPGEYPSFLIFDFSTSPLLLFYTYIPAIVAAMFLGIVVLQKDKSLVGKLLFFIACFFSLWVLNILVLWIASYNDVLYFGWQITPILEIPLFIFSAYFTLVMTSKERNDIKPSLKMFFLFLIAVVFALLPTHFNIINYDIAVCEGKPGLLFWFMYGGEIITIILLLLVCIRRFFRTPKNDPFRREIFYIGASISSFLILFNASNLIGQITGIQEISFIGSLGMVIFLGCLVYLIVKYKEFNIKIIGAVALVLALVALIFSLLFVGDIQMSRVIVLITLGISAFFGALLIRSVEHEIEQRKKIEKLAADLEDANHQKDELLSMVSHQLATPVTGLKGYLEMFNDGDLGPLTIEQQGNVQVMMDVTRNLSDLVSMILDVSRLQLGRLKLEQSPCNLSQLFRDIYEIVFPKAKEKRIDLTFNLPPSFPPATLDERYTHMAIENLVQNAIKYTPNGGKVDVTVAIQNNVLTLVVSDTGIGIPRKDQPNIFGKLFRASNVRNSKIDGNGFGLYIVKGAIESQGGTIGFTSEEGMGTTFHATLPLKGDDSAGQKTIS